MLTTKSSPLIRGLFWLATTSTLVIFALTMVALLSSFTGSVKIHLSPSNQNVEIIKR